MSIPIPGKPVRGSKSGVPIMALFDLLGRSWAMGVIWQLQNGHTLSGSYRIAVNPFHLRF